MEDVLPVYHRPFEANRPRLCFDQRPCQGLDDGVVGLRVEPGKAGQRIGSAGDGRGLVGL